MVNVSQQSTLVESLGARRHIDGWVLREEVDGLEADFEHLTRHHGEILDAWDLWREGGISKNCENKTDNAMPWKLRLTWLMPN